MKKVTLYSLSTCPACKRVKEFLDGNSIPYTLIEVDKLEGGEQWVVSRELAKHNPQGTYPTTIIEDAVIGYDVDELKSRLTDI
ncbi:MAG: glutaredoxin [Nitrospirae bacterium]|nr:glutaredoxin [Nitrospirota bacterium]